MATTRYFAEQVLRKRPYLTEQMCGDVIARPLRVVVQPHGRFRLWGSVNDPRDGAERILRVVVLEDGQTTRSSTATLNPARHEAALLP